MLDPKPPLIDDWVKTNDEMAFAACKRLMYVLLPALHNLGDNASTGQEA